MYYEGLTSDDTTTLPASKDTSFRFDITNDKNLAEILELAFSEKGEACAYKVKNGRLILSWVGSPSPASDWSSFLTPLTASSMVGMVKDWLATQDYGKEPNHDGTAVKGFHVYNERWGQIDNDYQAFVAIEPHWIFCGK